MWGDVVDRIFVGGRILTVDPHDTVAEAVAIAGGRIVRVGSNDEIRGLASDRASTVDLRGRTVVPGMTDAHTHLELAAIGLRLLVDIHTPPCESIDDILERLREACLDRPAGEWVIGQGNIFQEARLKERRYPTGAELDRVSTSHKIAIRLGGHITILNSAAREAAGLRRGLSQPRQGTFLVDDGGEPTGHTIDMWDSLGVPPYSSAEKQDAMKEVAMSHFLSLGITALGDVTDTVEGFRATQALSLSGQLPLRIACYPRVPRAMSFDSLIESGVSAGFGNDLLWIAGVKIFADGGMTGRLAATHEPYQEVNSHGKMFWSREELLDMVDRCNAADLQPMIHCAGDRATDDVLDVMEEALAKNPRSDHRWRIEHIGNPFGTDSRLRRIADLGVVAVPQPPHLYSIGDAFIDVFGVEQAQLTMRLRTMIDLGMRPAGSSDLTASQPESSNPFAAIWTSIRRTTYSGVVISPEESISAMEGLRMYTNDSAYAIRQDHCRGSLEPGMQADLVVLDRDLSTIPDDDIRNIQVDATFVDGKCVFGRAGGPFDGADPDPYEPRGVLLHPRPTAQGARS